MKSTEAEKAGESVTKEPKTHIFMYENIEIHVIDTPGLLDTEDQTGSHDKDKQHVTNILRLLSAYDEIHACARANSGAIRTSIEGKRSETSYGKRRKRQM